MPAEQGGDGRRGALEADMLRVDSSSLLEDLACQVRTRGGARGAVIERAWLGLCLLDQLLDGVQLGVALNEEQVRRIR